MEKRRARFRHSLLPALLTLAGLAGCSRGGGDHLELAYGVIRDQPPSRLVLIQDDGKKARRLTGVERGTVTTLPDWSPDGQRIAFVRYNAVEGSGGRGTGFDVHVVGADGSDDRSVGPGNAPRWTSDGRFLLVERTRAGTRSSDIYVVSAESGRARLLTAGSSPVPSHRGSRVVFIRYVYRLDTNGECCIVVSSTLYTISLDGTGLRRLGRITRPDVHFSQAAWLPDDSAVSVIERSSQVVGGKLVTYTRAGRGRVIVPNVGEAYDWSSQGERLAYTYGGSSYVAGSDGKAIDTFSGLDAFDVKWSPDGKKVAMTVNDDPVSNMKVGIYVVEFGHGRPTRIASEAGSTAYLDWRPLAVGDQP